MATPQVAGVVTLVEAMYARLKPDVLDVALAAGLLMQYLARNGPHARENTFYG